MEPGRDPISDIEALETELAAYQSALDEDTGLGDLRDRPRIVILNKVDIPDALELAEFLKEDIEAKFGWPVFIISAVARKGLDPLRYKLLEIVQEDRRKRPKQKREERIVVRPQAVDSRKKKKDFEIIEDPDVENGYVVLGEKPERWIIQTDFENDEAVGYLADRLARMGVEEELFKKGARPGCTVSIGEVSFEWEPTTAAGVEVTMSGRGTDMRLDKNTRMSASERKRASQVRRGLIDEFDFGEGQEVTRESANRDRWQG